MPKSNWKKRLDAPPSPAICDCVAEDGLTLTRPSKVDTLATSLLVAYINKNGRLAPDVTRELLACAKEAGQILGWIEVSPPTPAQEAELEEVLSPL